MYETKKHRAQKKHGFTAACIASRSERSMRLPAAIRQIQNPMIFTAEL